MSFWFDDLRAAILGPAEQEWQPCWPLQPLDMKILKEPGSPAQELATMLANQVPGPGQTYVPTGQRVDLAYGDFLAIAQPEATDAGVAWSKRRGAVRLVYSGARRASLANPLDDYYLSDWIPAAWWDDWQDIEITTTQQRDAGPTVTANCRYATATVQRTWLDFNLLTSPNWYWPNESAGYYSGGELGKGYAPAVVSGVLIALSIELAIPGSFPPDVTWPINSPSLMAVHVQVIPECPLSGPPESG